MRTLVLSSLIGLTLALGACKEPDPNKFETHIERIKDPDKRATGFAGLEKLVKAVVTAPDRDQRLGEFAERVVPAFVEIWDDAPEQREAMLTILRDAGHVSGCALWSKALPLDGSAESRKETLLALEGIKKAKASACAGDVIEGLKTLVAKPKFDEGSEAGRVRLEMVDTLGVLRSKEAVPVLIEVMQQTQEKQPVAVHRGAATALGEIGDPSATDALLTVTFRVPDSPSTSDIGNRSKLALVAIGSPAVPRVLEMLRGNHEEVNKLAAENGVDLLVVKQTAAGILGAMGTSEATEELVAFMPKEDCGGGKPKGEPDAAAVGLRAFVAQALGFIGDEAAVEPLCSCVHATHNPGDMWEIVQALGRIGGEKALECLLGVVKTGEYDAKYLEDSAFTHEIRWEGARFAVLVAKPEQMDQVKGALGSNQGPKAKEKMAAWQSGIDLAQECKDDKGCYLKVLQDASADWFAREKAAYELVRVGKGDPEIALEIAKAFKVRNPDARVTMALFPPRILGDQKCGECVDAYEAILKAEKGSMDATMQLPVLVARNTMARLESHQDRPQAAPSGGGAAEAKGDEPKAPEAEAPVEDPAAKAGDAEAKPDGA